MKTNKHRICYALCSAIWQMETLHISRNLRHLRVFAQIYSLFFEKCAHSDSQNMFE